MGGLNIYELTKLSVTKELDFINTLVLTDREQMIASLILKEIKAVLAFFKMSALIILRCLVLQARFPEERVSA